MLESLELGSCHVATEMRVGRCSVSLASKLAKLGTLCGVNGEDQANGRSSFLLGCFPSGAPFLSINGRSHRVLQRWALQGMEGRLRMQPSSHSYP